MLSVSTRNLGFAMIGALIGVLAGSALTAQSFERWHQSQVRPIILVKPELGSFVPVDGTTIGIRWTKDQVVPVCQVKPGIIGFVPENGMSIGNDWRKEQVVLWCS